MRLHLLIQKLDPVWASLQVETIIFNSGIQFIDGNSNYSFRYSWIR